MRTKPPVAIGVVVVTAFFGGAVEAQKQKLPNGRPFALLRDAVAQSQLTLLQQIESLQAKLDANTTDDKIQSQLIASMQTLTAQLATTLSATEASVSALVAYNQLQDQLLQQQLAQVSALQAKVNAWGDPTQLWSLYQAQQSAITTLTTQLEFLMSQGFAQQSDVMLLSQQLAALKSDYTQTSARLAAGCGANSSIRQLTMTTVVCEPDNGANLQGAEFIGNPVAAPPGSTVTADAFCAATSPPYISSGGGVSATLGITILQSVRLSTNGWRVIVQNPSALTVVVQARVSCLRVN